MVINGQSRPAKQGPAQNVIAHLSQNRGTMNTNELSYLTLYRAMEDLWRDMIPFDTQSEAVSPAPHLQRIISFGRNFASHLVLDCDIQ